MNTTNNIRFWVVVDKDSTKTYIRSYKSLEDLKELIKDNLDLVPEHYKIHEYELNATLLKVVD